MMQFGDGESCRESRYIAADAGDALELSRGYLCGEPAAAVVSRLGNLRQTAFCFSFWMQLRGTAQVEAAEGGFRLRRGDWIAFDADARPELQAGRTGLTIGVLLPVPRTSAAAMASDRALFPGRGRMRNADSRLALRLWRAYALQPGTSAATRANKPLLLHLQHLQRDLHALHDRCPGRSAARRNQVLTRMQRAQMLLEGNVHRSVRLDELAQLSRFSEWWVSKIFRAIYGETVQQASIRLRMQRARELLEQTSLSISELGDACGFHDPCSFARLFKHCHGLTASRWRALHQARGQTVPSRSPGFPAAIARTGT